MFLHFLLNRHQSSSLKSEAKICSDDKRVIVGSEDSFIYIYNLLSGAVEQKIPTPHRRGVSSIAYHPSPTRAMFISAAFDGSVICWEEDKSQSQSQSTTAPPAAGTKPK